MIRNVTLTYDIDEETGVAENLVCTMGDLVARSSKPRTTAKKPTPKKDEETIAKVRLESNKIVLNTLAAEALKAEYGCRVIVKYQVMDKLRVPVIGTDLAWEEEGNGNKLTKTNTVSYRGNANTILAEYGSEFDIEEDNDGIFKLIPVGGIPEGVGTVVEKPKKAPKKKKEEGPQTKVVDVNMSEIKEMSRDTFAEDRGSDLDISKDDEINDFGFSL